MADGQGAEMALPIWGLYMQKVYKDKSLGYSESERFQIPDGFDPCGDSLEHSYSPDKEDYGSNGLDELFE
jgi:penicillin-binding protein 1A